MAWASRRRYGHWLVFSLCIITGSRCATTPDSPAGMDDMMTAPDMQQPDRPFQIVVPPQYDASKPTPLLILLHGYSESGAQVDAYFGLSQTAQDKGFLYVYPDGTKDDTGLRFWNATDGCCNLYGSQVDDVGYLKSIIQTAQSRYNVDPKRIFLAGHSNGGFMAYRMACDAADTIAGIVSLAGATWQDSARCTPSAKVAILEVHGDMDAVIRYEGGTFGASPASYPSAHDTVAQWAKYNACATGLADSGIRLDLDASEPGSETRVERYGNCPQSAVELWTIQGGGHFPSLQPFWGDEIYQFLANHPKP